MFLFRLPELSDDIYRYLWDGLTVLHGNNPYALAPSGAKPFSAESAALLGHVNHPHLVTIYPPAAQVFFAIGAFLGGILGIKAVLIALDIAVCAVMLRLLSWMKMPPSRAVLYAWHPLPILEIASSGHIDGAGIFLLMLAFMLLFPPRDDPNFHASNNWAVPAAAGLVFSIAMLVKLFPLVFLPILLFLAGRKGRGPFIIGVVSGTAALSIPFLPGLSNMFTTLDIYVRNWEFAGFAFQSLHEIFPSGGTARQILAVSFLLITATLYASLFRKRENPAEEVCTPSLFPEAFKTAYCVALAFLLLTPTLHPWYALYLACLLPFVSGTAGLVMTWAVLLSYRVLINFTLLGTWEDKDAIPAIIWVATIGAALLSWLVRKRLLDFFGEEQSLRLPESANSRQQPMSANYD
ncbi:MAG: glycosyltransferase 87 family protein [Thiothrix sp.]|uniref:glycosyltransferase 87 family protein n=1 Tax=Thiothrix sp. TaxID=1032 RepID=UPI00261C4BF2|nr:glycosyltransferase 87 family protein [Thiothrix sp.]MDD5395435.1 glycosyltransferase 87 family protein [Thiothrix sp.]